MSLSIGVIYCGFGTKDLVVRSLEPWVNLRAQYMGQFDRRAAVHICAVSVRFAGFEGEDDGTCDVLRGYKARGDIDHLMDGPQNVPEATARGLALQYLRDKVDLVWLADSDEFYTEDEISRVIRHVEENPWIVWWRLSLKNYVIDGKTHLVEPFTPPRLFRVNASGYRVHSFSGDNDIQYGGVITRDILPQERFASATVPKETAWVRHESWMSNERGKRKQAYQAKRWGANVCSFAWDDTHGGLIFNPALPAPKIVREES